MSEGLTFNNTKYASREALAAAKRAWNETQQKLERSRQRRAEDFERRLKEKFVAAGGTADEWAKERDTILREARKQAALTGADAARALNASRYTGGA